MSITIDQFVKSLTSTGLVADDEVSTIFEKLPAESRNDVKALAKVLIREAWIIAAVKVG